MYRRALWKQNFGRSFNFSSLSDNGQFFNTFGKKTLEWLSTLQSTFTGERSGNVLVFKTFSITLGLWKFFPKTFVKDGIEQFLKLFSTFSQNLAVFSIFFCFLSTFPGFERENRESLSKMVLQRSQKCNIVSERSFRLFFSFSVKMKGKSYRYGALCKNLFGFCPNINCRFAKLYYTCLEESS